MSSDGLFTRRKYVRGSRVRVLLKGDAGEPYEYIRGWFVRYVNEYIDGEESVCVKLVEEHGKYKENDQVVVPPDQTKWYWQDRCHISNETIDNAWGFGMAGRG